MKNQSKYDAIAEVLKLYPIMGTSGYYTLRIVDENKFLLIVKEILGEEK